MSKKFSNDKELTVRLENERLVPAKYLEVPRRDGTVEKKVFFKTSGKKEFVVKNLSTDMKRSDWKINFIQEINDYLYFLREQSKLEFPKWLERNGKHALEEYVFYSIKEIEQEWKIMHSLFGSYRIAADCGFYTSRKPMESSLSRIVEVQEIFA